LTYSESDDEELTKAVLDGDHEAFAGLVARHQRKVLGFCLSMLVNPQTAEDAAQEIFTKAFTALPQFRGGAAFSTWLYRIAYNHCCNIRAKDTRTRQESLDSMAESERDKVLSAQVPGAEPAETDLSAMALGELPAEYRAVLALRLEGESYAAIAAALGTSVDSVKARLRRARAILRIRLRHLLPEDLSKPTEHK